MNNIIIVGAGPRSLAIALQLAYYKYTENYNITIIDPSPINSWSYPNIVQDIVMRSPISFDLTTYIKDLQKHSLNTYLGYDKPFTSNQQEIEECNIRLNRKQFSSYLNKIYNYILVNNIKIVKEKVISINANEIKTNLNTYQADNIIIALGNTGNFKIPNWVKQTDLKNKLVPIQTLIRGQIDSTKVAILGSGQGAAELVHYAANYNKVYWCTNHSIKVEEYPAPSFKDWGVKSALGGYYKTLIPEKRLPYLMKVKEWQPSITPYINNELNNFSHNIVTINPKDTEDVQEVFDSCEYVILATGEDINLSNYPLGVKLERDIYNNNFPLLTKGFKSVSHPSISFTGSIAAFYDGPRQNSIISSAITAKEIIENLI